MIPLLVYTIIIHEKTPLWGFGVPLCQLSAYTAFANFLLLKLARENSYLRINLILIHVAILITTIGAFKVFEFVYVLTQGGPSNATQVLGTYIYLQAFNLLHMGYANALSVVLLIIALILGWFQLKASRRA